MDIRVAAVLEREPGGPWRRRGQGPLVGRLLWRLATNPVIRVVHVYGEESRDIAPADHELFAAEAAQLMAASPGSDFTGYEFKCEVSGERW